MQGTTTRRISILCTGLVLASALSACVRASNDLPIAAVGPTQTARIVVVTAEPAAQAPIVITATGGPTQTPHVLVVTATPEPTVEPTAIPTEAPPTAVPTAPPPPTVAPTQAPPRPDGLVATVFNGGNVREQPHVRGNVLDQINAGEYVQLLERSADGGWYRIRNAREIAGWVSVSLLTVAPDVAAQVAAPAYNTLDVRELVKNPERYKGSNIKMTGTVFNIDEADGFTYLQMMVQIPGGSQWDTEAVIVLADGALSGVYEDTVITVYGGGAGTETITNAYGGQVVQPVIIANYVMY